MLKRRGSLAALAHELDIPIGELAEQIANKVVVPTAVAQPLLVEKAQRDLEAAQAAKQAAERAEIQKRIDAERRTFKELEIAVETARNELQYAMYRLEQPAPADDAQEDVDHWSERYRAAQAALAKYTEARQPEEATA